MSGVIYSDLGPSTTKATLDIPSKAKSALVYPGLLYGFKR